MFSFTVKSCFALPLSCICLAATPAVEEHCKQDKPIKAATPWILVNTKVPLPAGGGAFQVGSVCHCMCVLGTSGAASILDHPGDLSPKAVPDAAEAFRNLFLVCHTKPTAVNLSLARRGEAWGFCFF